MILESHAPRGSTSLDRPAVRLLLLVAAITMAVIVTIRLIALHGSGGLTPIFFRLLIIPDDHAAMWMLAMLVVAAALASKYRWVAAIQWCGRRPVTVSVITALTLCLGTLLIYRNTRLSMDEYLAYFQSQVFASGNLTGLFPRELKQWVVPIVFLTMSVETGQTISGYLPGFALILTPFTWLGIPWGCNATLTGLTILVIHKLAMRLYADQAAAGLAVVLTVASPVVFANGISYYSMTACMLANATFALLLLSDPTPRRLLLAGVVGSIALTLHSPARHVPFAVPWLLWVLTRRQGFRNLAIVGAGYAPLTLVFGLGWMWLNSRLVDATAGDYQQGLAHVFLLPTTDLLVARAGALAKLWVWAVPGLLVLAVAGAWERRRDVRVLVLAASALCLMGAYLFVRYDQGHGWGYRYIHSAWFVFPLLAASLAASRPGDAPQRPESGRNETLNLVAAIAIVSLVAGIGLRAWQMHGFIDEHLAQQPQYRGSGARVVFIDTSQCFYCVDLIQNDPFLRDSEIRLHSHGMEKNAALAQQYWPRYRRLHADRFGEVYGRSEQQ